jgi:hypothetical protein
MTTVRALHPKKIERLRKQAALITSRFVTSVPRGYKPGKPARAPLAEKEDIQDRLRRELLKDV